MSDSEHAEQIGYDHGQADAWDGKTPMTDRQLSYHSDEYARGYRNGYAQLAAKVQEAK